MDIVHLFGGAYKVSLVKHEDDRGFFANILCQDALKGKGLEVGSIDQVNLSFSKRRGTLRGMHYQAEPHTQVKMIRCQKGSVYDVIVDMRRDSVKYLRWAGIVLDARIGDSLVVPAGFAQGFMTLEDDTEILYLNHGFYDGACERGIRWNDPRVAIRWPQKPEVISVKDSSWELL
jgi:dTDP-4-dehydrorhamnose 3,5-epimerase